MVIGTFFVSYFPSLVLGIDRRFPNELPVVTLRILASTAASINSFANPLIYLFYHRKYRQRIANTLIRRYNTTITGLGRKSDHEEGNIRLVKPALHPVLPQ